jgi:hypothetical protein
MEALAETRDMRVRAQKALAYSPETGKRPSKSSISSASHGLRRRVFGVTATKSSLGTAR